MKRRPLTANGLLGLLPDRPEAILKTNTRRGPVYATMSSLRPVPTSAVEALIDRRMLVPGGEGPLGAASAQVFRLASEVSRCSST